MAGGASKAVGGVLEVVGEIVGMLGGNGNGGLFKKDCTDLVRRIALLKHLLEEIRDCGKLDELNNSESSSSSCSSSLSKGSWWNDLVLSLQAAKRLLSIAANFASSDSSVSFYF